MRSRDSEVDLNLAQRIASRCVALAPDLVGGKGVEGLDIVRHNVGFRPSREGGARLEVEFMGIGLVVHNYGAHVSKVCLTVGSSGAGYQSSWGMATVAADLMEEALAKSA
jgi:D-amino-acid oxidase